MEKEFVRVRSVRDIVLSAILLVAGVALFFVDSTSVNIFGACLAVPGVLMLLFLKTDYKDTESGAHFRRVIKYYPASRKSEVLGALKSSPAQYNWVEGNSANGLMVDIYVGLKEDKVFLRVSEFIPYSYEPCSEWFSYSKAEAGDLAK